MELVILSEMRRILSLSCLLLSSILAATAQYTMQLYGTTFNIELDEHNMTAAIHDYNYKVDDTKFPIKRGTRKFKALGKEHSKTVIIPETYKAYNGKLYTITVIGKAAFAGFQGMDFVVIPPTVTTIEDYAFFRSSLISVEIPATVVSMGNRVFGRCKELKNLRIPQGLAMGKDVYSDCEDVNVKFYSVDEPPALAQSQKPASKPVRSSKPKAKVYASSSDVDEGIPATGKNNDDVFAIIIANENYLRVPKVNCALNDGRTFRHYCRQTLGIPDDNIHMLEDATFGQMTEEMNWLTRVAKVFEGDSRIIIYYAGHGIPNEKDGSAYLLPIDNSGNNTAAAYSLNKLYKELGSLNAKSVTVFLDACFSGSQRGEGMLTAARGVAMSYKAEDPLGNMVVFSATQGDETAYPYAEKGHGLFTYYLLKKLKETKGNVDYGTLGDYIKREVSRKSIVINNKPQTPTVAPSREMVLTWRNLAF